MIFSNLFFSGHLFQFFEYCIPRGSWFIYILHVRTQILNINIAFSGNSLKYHDGQMFTTFDNDNDQATNNCADQYSGGWWFLSCKHAHLNGRYLLTNPTGFDDDVQWKDWRGDKYSLKSTEMKIRRL